MRTLFGCVAFLFCLRVLLVDLLRADLKMRVRGLPVRWTASGRKERHRRVLSVVTGFRRS